jgi:hypothetical protein
MYYSKLLLALPIASLVALACSADDNNPTNTSAAVGSGGSTVSSSSSGDASNTSNGSTTSTASGGNSKTITTDNVIEEAAKSVCSALTRCCDASSQTFYFDPIRDAEFLQEFKDQMPDGETLTEDACLTLMKGIYPKLWLGSWLDRVAANEAQFVPEAAASCLESLDAASCGAPLRDALFDTTCFSNSAPSGGEQQRVFFKRTQSDGDSCAPIRDGFGGLYFGSCQPDNSFCCIEDSQGNCSPFPSLTKTGTCKKAGQAGETCSEYPLELCATGLFCNVDNLKCEKPSYKALQVGEACMDGIDFLGECLNGFCDFTSKVCMPLKKSGEACAFAVECVTNWCDQTTLTCIDNPVCSQ